jgi:hypothetical protein
MINANLKKPWTTYMGVLVKVLLMSQGDVIELGAGPFSTPLLHWICKDMNRLLVSYENRQDYYNYARQYQSRLHRIRLVKSWDEVETKTHRGVVFVDHAPGARRTIDAVRFRDSADYLVLHDTEVDSYYQNIWQYFKHIYTWRECQPWVSVVSNFKDLSGLRPEPTIKNLMIYVSPTGSFDNPRPDLTSNDADTLVKVQIDNSFEMGWKSQDLLLVTNFNYEYRGIKAHVLKNVDFFERKPQASKINAILKLFENGMIEDGQLFWFHDLDAYQVQPITESELELDGVDMALTDYGCMDRWNTASVFFKTGAKDIFSRIKEVTYEKNTDEERALNIITENDETIKRRVKKLNSTYNFNGFSLKSCYSGVTKPIKVAHFHPDGKLRRLGYQRGYNFFTGENELRIPLITEKLTKILNSHGIN